MSDPHAGCFANLLRRVMSQRSYLVGVLIVVADARRTAKVERCVAPNSAGAVLFHEERCSAYRAIGGVTWFRAWLRTDRRTGGWFGPSACALGEVWIHGSVR